jgi:hypothetical protein
MPRYHLKIRGSDLRVVKKEMPIVVKRHVSGKGREVTVELHARNAKAAKASVVARLPDGGDAKVVGPARKVKD